MKKMKFHFDKNEAVKTGKFLLGFVVFFLVLNFFVGLLPLEWLEYATAVVAFGVLNLFGVGSEIFLEEPVRVVLAEHTIVISYLCTGALEILVLVSAIAASFGIDWAKRLYGVAFGVIAGLVFNQLRIILSVLVILGVPIEVAELTHDVLFRVVLLAVVAGLYFLWFRWAIKAKNN